MASTLWIVVRLRPAGTDAEIDRDRTVPWLGHPLDDQARRGEGAQQAASVRWHMPAVRRMFSPRHGAS